MNDICYLKRKKWRSPVQWILRAVKWFYITYNCYHTWQYVCQRLWNFKVSEYYCTLWKFTNINISSLDGCVVHIHWVSVLVVEERLGHMRSVIDLKMLQKHDVAKVGYL